MSKPYKHLAIDRENDYRIYSHISRKISDKIMPQKLGRGRLISGSILARRLDLLLRLSWNVIIAH